MPFPRGAAFLLAIGVASTAAEPGWACGVSGPDGISGCSLAEYEEAHRPRFRAGVSGVYTATALRFSGENRGDQTRIAAIASLAYDPARRVSLTVGLGATLSGELDMAGGRYLFAPGPVALVGASWRLVEGKPFVSLSADFSSSVATTEPSGSGAGPTGYEAFDLRAGVACGTTLFDVLTPYALARVFGGPVYWRYLGTAVTGTDVSHYQLGAGFAVAVARRVDGFVEVVPLGERAVAAGAAIAF